MATMFWIWMAAAVIFLILEILTPGLIFAAFAVAAGIAGVYGQFYPEEYYWQIGIFVGLSIVLLPLMRPVARKITKPSPVISNVDGLIGQVGLITKAIDPDSGGQIRLHGEVWRAVSEIALAENNRAKVVSVSGNKLVVEKADDRKE